MSMRGQLLSEQYQNTLWGRDDNGQEYVCYATDLESQYRVSETEKQLCLDANQVLGPNW